MSVSLDGKSSSYLERKVGMLISCSVGQDDPARRDGGVHAGHGQGLGDDVVTAASAHVFTGLSVYADGSNGCRA